MCRKLHAHVRVKHPHVRNDDPLGVCLKGEVRGGEGALPVCDSTWSPERAPACSYFESLHSKEVHKHLFSKRLEGLTLPEIARDYPDMAALLWVLGDDTEGESDGAIHVSPIGDGDPGIMGSGTSAAAPMQVGPEDTETPSLAMAITGEDGRSLRLEPEGSVVVTEPGGDSFRVAEPGSEDTHVETPMPWWSRLLGTLR